MSTRLIVVDEPEASCARQGVPVKITDPLVLRDVVILLKATGP